MDDGLRDYQRMRDLVRLQRHELMNSNAITMEEFALLAEDHPAVVRLTSYDELREQLAIKQVCIKELMVDAAKRDGYERVQELEIVRLKAEVEKLDSDARRAYVVRDLAVEARMKSITLTDKQAHALSNLLGQYQEFLEGAIHGELIPGSDSEEHFDTDTRQRVNRDRRRWRACEDFQLLLRPEPSKRAEEPALSDGGQAEMDKLAAMTIEQRIDFALRFSELTPEQIKAIRAKEAQNPYE